MSEGPAGLERLDAGAHLAATPLPAESLQAGPGNCRAGGSIPALPDWAPSAESPAVGRASNCRQTEPNREPCLRTLMSRGWG